MRYKRRYIIIWVFTLLAGASFFLADRWYQLFDEKDITLIVGVVALLVSVVSLAIADPNLRKFEGRLEIWNTGDKKNNDYRCMIRLVNCGEHPLVNLKVQFRYPDSFFNPMGDPKKFDYFKLEGALIVNDDKYQFLGCDLENNYADFEHWLSLERWRKEVIISIHADEMNVMTFVLKPELAPDLEAKIGKAVIFEA